MDYFLTIHKLINKNFLKLTVITYNLIVLVGSLHYCKFYRSVFNKDSFYITFERDEYKVRIL